MSREIPLSMGLVALVDDDDYEFIAQWRWLADRRGGVVRNTAYARRADDGAYMHRVIMAATQGQLIDHISGDGLDNRRDNLRRADALGNSVNVRRPPSRSGLRGVYQRRPGFAWRMQIRVEGKNRTFCGFATAEDAARAYDAKAKELFGEFAVLNFPGEREA